MNASGGMSLSAFQVLYFSTIMSSILGYFILLLHYIYEGNMALSTQLHLFDGFSY